jgi:outer membrane protein OmpA-like peptidoglycan-associated protein
MTAASRRRLAGRTTRLSLRTCPALNSRPNAPAVEGRKPTQSAPGTFNQPKEPLMTKRLNSWPQFAAIFSFALLAACASHDQQQARSQTPSPPPPSSHPSVYQVSFGTNQYDINLAGQRAIEDVASVVDDNNAVFVTIVGRTDTAGSADYNTQLSHRRATAVRDALLATGKITPGHIETAWTGQEKQAVGTNAGVAEAQNRVVDIYIH